MNNSSNIQMNKQNDYLGGDLKNGIILNEPNISAVPLTSSHSIENGNSGNSGNNSLNVSNNESTNTNVPSNTSVENSNDLHEHFTDDEPPFHYIGSDIVPNLIEGHKRKFPQYSWMHLDMCSDKLPVVDLVLCRATLQHLPLEHIFAALDNISRSGSKYLLATTFLRQDDLKNKHDIGMGDCNSRNLLKEPFCLSDPLVLHSEQDPWHYYLGLWALPLRYDKEPQRNRGFLYS